MCQHHQLAVNLLDFELLIGLYIGDDGLAEGLKGRSQAMPTISDRERVARCALSVDRRSS